MAGEATALDAARLTPTVFRNSRRFMEFPLRIFAPWNRQTAAISCSVAPRGIKFSY
jgi:hypothetical protein